MSDIRIITAQTITSLMDITVRQHIEEPKPDAVLNIETHLFNTILIANSCDYDFDIGSGLWLNIGRWSRLCKEYVPKDGVNRFVDQACEIMTGEARLGATANLMFRDPDRYAKKHRWGGCLMGATFRGDNKKAGAATITFYSRTTYMGYMALMDAGIANVLARMIWNQVHGKLLNNDFSGIRIGFRWHISSQQLHCFKTLPYIYSQPDLMEKLERIAKHSRVKVTPTWHHLGIWYRKVLQHFNDHGKNVERFLAGEKYGPFRRIKRRWCEAKGYLDKHIPPKLMVNSLSFDRSI